jgi:transketolase
MKEPDRRESATVNALRFLAVDAVQKANSGHPGLPLGAAPMAYALWARHLRYDATDPQWSNRDRFVLSAGHGSALLYALLHLFGFALPLSELEAFRQWGSRTPGHPERLVTPGVEVTTGPLGQGVANAVGLAIAERHLAAVFNRPNHPIVDHRTYVIAGDGDLMEGISYEACALAGHLRLGKLAILFDSNDICLAGTTSLSTSEDVVARFKAIGWHVNVVRDGNDLHAIDRALDDADKEPGRPSLIVVKTTIGYGSPHKQNTYAAHGSPLGDEEVAATKRALGWPETPAFFVPDDVRSWTASLSDAARRARTEWDARFEAYGIAFPKEAAEFTRRMAGRLPEGGLGAIPRFEPDSKGMATRKASEFVLQAIGERFPELFGGSADLNPSTLTWLKDEGDFESADEIPADPQGAVGRGWGYGGRNVHFGVREHAMAAIVNGAAAHGGLIPYAATFLVFSDYMRPAIRLAALSGHPSIFVFTHDSVGVGEDGPTHQPVEHVMSLRLIPNLVVLRPADANETAEAWRIALERRDGPTALILSRQSLPVLDRSALSGAEGVKRGAYVLSDTEVAPRVTLIASGSEVPLVLEAARQLAEEGLAARVVSMPSWELFEAQPLSYREAVFPASAPHRIAVEAGRTSGWERYTGDRGEVVGIDRFGASAPGSRVQKELGMTAEAVVRAAKRVLDR